MDEDHDATRQYPRLEPCDATGAPSPLARLGTRVRDYQILELLGAGGFGCVYRGQHALAGWHAAVKIIEAQESYDQATAARFQTEARILHELRHPNVVPLYEFARLKSGEYFMVTELLEGQTVRARLRERGPLPIAEATRIVLDAAAGLGAAHRKGIVHRDVAPENLMIVSDGEAGERTVVIDFGIAKPTAASPESVASRSPKTQAHGFVGRPDYCSPEHAGILGVDRVIDARSDLYSLGVILYELVTGQRPLDGDTWQAKLVALFSQQPKPPSSIRPDLGLPPWFDAVVMRCLAKDPDARFGSTDELAQALDEGLAQGGAVSGTAAGLRIALLYKRHAEPDERLLEILSRAFTAAGHRVFIDRHLAVGVDWAKAIEHEIRTADAVVVLLSATSLASEMLSYELELARQVADESGGRPRILPVRVAYEGPLPGPLGTALDRFNWTLWSSLEDDARVIADLQEALTGSASSAQPDRRSISSVLASHVELEAVGGAVPLGSKYYVTRATDREFLNAVGRRDSIVLVKGARQMGKSSLLARGLQQARSGTARVGLADLQSLCTSELASADTFLRALAESLAEQLDLDVSPGDRWKAGTGATTNFGRFLRRDVLGALGAPLVWGLDEIDRLFAFDYATDVFAMFRSWHNARSLDPEGPWGALTLAIAYATEAHLFITDVNQSPFNVGTRITLDDFNSAQISDLNFRHGSPLQGDAQLRAFMDLVGGHPYLVRRGLNQLVDHGLDVSSLAAKAPDEDGPFGDHLRRMLVLLAQDEGMQLAMLGVLRGQACPDHSSFYRLRSAGLITGDTPQAVRPRCGLYASYLARHLR